VSSRGLVAVTKTKTKTKTCVARAIRWDKGWELHVEGVGVTQSHGLTDAVPMIVDYVRVMTGEAPEKVDLHIEVGDNLDELIALTRRHVAQAAEAQKVAAEESRKVARRLKDKGLTGRDIAAVLGVSPQRVSQLTSA
jgi:hypothetical protein